MYINAWTILDLTHDELMDEMEWWLSSERMDIWVAAIQAEDTKNVGWALHSTNQIDWKALTEAMSRCIGCLVAD